MTSSLKEKDRQIAPGRKRKLLIVSYYYPPVGGIGLPGCMRVVKFIKYLEDWNISVLTIRPDKYPEFFKMDNPISLPIRNEKINYSSVTDIFRKLLSIRNVVFSRSRPGNKGSDHGHDSHRETMSPKTENGHPGPGMINRIKDIIHDICYFPDFASPWIPNAVVAGFKVIRNEKPDIMFATGMPWSVLVIVKVLHRVTGVPYICDFRDPWVDNPFHKSKGYVFDKMNKALEKTVVWTSALVTANTSGLKQHMVKRYPYLSENRIVELPNGYDPDDFKYKDSIEENVKIQATLKLVHAGFLYGERDPSPILKSIKIVHDRYKYNPGEIKFIQVGSLENNIQEEIDKYVESGYAQCLGQIPHQDCIGTLGNADVLVIIQQGTETQIPSKIYEYICLGLPIMTITKRGGALWDLLERYRFGDQFEPGDIENISDKIQEYYRRKKESGRLQEEYPMRQEFDIRQISGKLSEYLTDICMSGSVKAGKPIPDR